jgi:hypothetical protein
VAPGPRASALDFDFGGAKATDPDNSRFDRIGGLPSSPRTPGRWCSPRRTSGGETTLWIRPLDALAVHPLAGTEGALLPFWSPDAGSIAFFKARELRKLSLATQTVETICTLPRRGSVGGTWGRDGTVLFSTGGPGARIYAVPAAGGEARPVTAQDSARGETGQTGGPASASCPARVMRPRAAS